VGAAIGDVLPLALGVAVSPIPIIAVILMLLSPKAQENGPTFLVGWVAGLAVVGIVVTALSGNAGLGSGGANGSALGSLIKLALGVLLLFLAFRDFRNRPRLGEQPPLPGWMRAIDSINPVQAFGFAVLLSAVNPKNLSLTVAAAVTIAQEGLSTVGATVALVIFVVLASLSIALPVALYLAGGPSARARLDSLRGWLNANNATVTAVLLLVIGVVLIGKGLGGLLG
jgi:threonine/homoserine/homoserine lactone efflux protein